MIADPLAENVVPVSGNGDEESNGGRLCFDHLRYQPTFAIDIIEIGM